MQIRLEKCYLSGDACHPVLDFCLHFAFALLVQDTTLLHSSPDLESRGFLRTVD